MDTKWDTVLFKGETDQSMLDRYKLRGCCMFIHNCTSSPLQTTATNYGWILRITSVGDLFPAVLGHLLCVRGSCAHIPLHVHHEPCKNAISTKVQKDPSYYIWSLLSQVMLGLKHCCCLFKSHSDHTTVIKSHYVQVYMFKMKIFATELLYQWHLIRHMQILYNTFPLHPRPVPTLQTSRTKQNDKPRANINMRNTIQTIKG